MWAAVIVYLYTLGVIVIICGGIEAIQVKFTSQYNGSNVIGYLGSSVTFVWEFTGDLSVADWGTKKSGKLQLDDHLISLGKSGQLPLIVPPKDIYDGRVNGSWDGTTPGQVTFTLSSIKEDDDKIFLCQLTPESLLDIEVYDTVQLVIRDPPKAMIVLPENSSVETAILGSFMSFSCNASGIPLPTIRWMKSNAFGATEITSDSVKYKVDSSSGSSQLIIKNVSVDDQSYYICNASSYEFYLVKVFLGVISLYKNHHSCPSTNQSATIGVSTSICCPVDGFPPPQVTWKYPNGTESQTGNTILPIVPKTKEDFGNYMCSVTGLKETVPDPIIVAINVQEEEQKTLIRAEKMQLKKGEMFSWNEVKGARNYICRICGPEIKCSSLLGDKPSLEIPYGTLKFKSPETKPDPVIVMIEVLAVGENDVIGRGGPFNLTISAATTPGLPFTLGIVVFMSTLNL